MHASPFDSTRLIVDPEVRYPPYNTNPELWIAPLPGTGMIAGQVWDSAGQPVYQARIYGLVKLEPRETPFSFIETYGRRNHSDPVYREHFGEVRRKLPLRYMVAGPVREAHEVRVTLDEPRNHALAIAVAIEYS